MPKVLVRNKHEMNRKKKKKDALCILLFSFYSYR